MLLNGIKKSLLSTQALRQSIASWSTEWDLEGSLNTAIKNGMALAKTVNKQTLKTIDAHG